MPNVIVTNLSPGELLGAAVTTAQQASTAILDLSNTPLTATESLVDRLKAIAKHAIKLAEAFVVIDSLASGSLSLSESSPRSQGCARGEDPTTN